MAADDVPSTRAYQPSPQLSHRLREARSAQSISLRRLAALIGVSPSLISQIETGKVRPSVNTLYAIASELGLSIDDLLDAGGDGRRAGEATRRAVVVRADERKVIELNEGARWERLSEPEPGTDFLNLVYAPGAESGTSPHRHAGREWGHVVRGELTIQVAGVEYRLRPGDSIAFDSTMPHRLANVGREDMHAIWFVLGRQGDARLQHAPPAG